jgi:ATP-dependent protease HslVU (ClpYQ) peptidase subunit
LTTIATDGFKLAGDGRSTRNDSITGRDHIKVVSLPDGSIVGGAGRTADAERALRHLLAEAPGDLKGDFTLLRLFKNGKIAVYEGTLLSPISMKAPAAIGSGSDAAMGAMLAGADARTAVQIAAKLDVYTGGKITSYSR